LVFEVTRVFVIVCECKLMPLAKRGKHLEILDGDKSRAGVETSKKRKQENAPLGRG
jgi:adenylylsulfate kinase-like enzyme